MPDRVIGGADAPQRRAQQIPGLGAVRRHFDRRLQCGNAVALLTLEEQRLAEIESGLQRFRIALDRLFEMPERRIEFVAAGQ